MLGLKRHCEENNNGETLPIAISTNERLVIVIVVTTLVAAVMRRRR
jgi:hypothetical protein